MPRLDVTQVEGFDELRANLVRLNDRVKRSEVIKLMRRLARPVVAAYRAQLPEDTGTLKRSVAIKSVPSRRSGGNPSIAVRPGRSGRNNAFYMFMIVPKGTILNGRNRGSRKGRNTVVPVARNRTLAAEVPKAARNAEVQTAAFVQRQIDRLSR